MDCSQVALEDVGTVKGLLRGRAGAWAEAADHCAFVVCESVTVLVILSSKALCVVLAGLNGALLRPLSLVSEHVSLEVLEGLAAVGIGASLLLLGLVTAILAWCRWNEMGDAWGTDMVVVLSLTVVIHWCTVGAAGKSGLKGCGLEKG